MKKRKDKHSKRGGRRPRPRRRRHPLPTAAGAAPLFFVRSFIMPSFLDLRAPGEQRKGAKALHSQQSIYHKDGAYGNLSKLARDRLDYEPSLPQCMKGPHHVVEGATRQAVTDMSTIRTLFPRLCEETTRVVTFEPGAAAESTARPLRVGVMLSGGQASGGHNVIIGVHDYLEKFCPGSQLFGFLGGARGVTTGTYRELEAKELAFYRNQARGGFHLIGSGRDKIEKPDQLAAAIKTCSGLDLDGLVVIGGDDSNTNAAVLAEHFLANGVKTRIIGVPKTIDGDLKNEDVAISFGFDTAAKIYSELVGNIMVDAASEEVAARRLSLRDITHQISDVVMARAMNGRNYGVVLIPEGLVEHAYDISNLIKELNELLAAGVDSTDHLAIMARLTHDSAGLFAQLPPSIRLQLLEERDPAGNVQVSHIELEKLLIRLVEAECTARKKEGRFSGKFNALAHFFGYEGRCSLPSNFDSTYTYALGHAAGALLEAGRTGLMANVTNMARPAREWGIGGTPLVSMMHLERRSGKDKPVIRKALVELEGPAMRGYRSVRDHWALHDCYRSPGPIQFHEPEHADVATFTLALELNDGAEILINTPEDGGAKRSGATGNGAAA
eukprot:scaffold1.g5505.t1